MRAYPVLAAGLFFLVTVAPQPSAAQMPAGIAAKRASRFALDSREGPMFDPAYEHPSNGGDGR